MLLSTDLQPPDEVPMYQSPEAINRQIGAFKTGDVAIFFLKGTRRAFVELVTGLRGFDQVYGCVETVTSDNHVIIWSPVFALLNMRAGLEETPDEVRRYGVADIDLIYHWPAEQYIELATEGRFAYGQEAYIEALVDGVMKTVVITVDSYLNGFLSGLTPDNQRLTYHADAFRTG